MQPAYCVPQLPAGGFRGVFEGKFRQDLYFRLNVIPLNVPPLRERLRDLDKLCDYFIDRFTEKYHFPFRLTPEQLGYMKLYG